MRSANHGDRTKANWLDPMIRVSDLILDAQDARVDFTEVDACNGFGPGALLGGHIFLNGPREAGLMRDSVPLLASIEVSGRLTRSPDLHQAPVFRGFWYLAFSSLLTESWTFGYDFGHDLSIRAQNGPSPCPVSPSR